MWDAGTKVNPHALPPMTGLTRVSSLRRQDEQKLQNYLLGDTTMWGNLIWYAVRAQIKEFHRPYETSEHWGDYR